MLWPVETTAPPSGRVPGRRSIANISRVPSAPSALVASSRTSSGGRRNTVRAKARRCCSPPESSKAQFDLVSRLRPCSVVRPTASRAAHTSASVKRSAASG
mmetsp:Transcript_67746/g.144980  ORF Transcript_67746/g.144980 Transcript_67746/m.144980 type:complete len:101 (-) Transcript_67746:2031-2333(-)